MKISISLTEIQEARPVPSGRYNLIIASAELGKSQKGLDQIKVSLAIEGHDTAPNVTHFISLPGPDDDANKTNFKALLLKRFLVGFNIPFSNDSFEIEDFFGATASCDLNLSEPDDNGNVYNRLQLPRLSTEGAGTIHKPSTGKPPKR